MPAEEFFTPPEPVALQDLAGRFGLEPGPGFVPSRTITGLASLASAGPGDLAFFNKKAPDAAFSACRAGACLVLPELAEPRHAGALPEGAALLLSPDPRAAFAVLQAALYRPRYGQDGQGPESGGPGPESGKAEGNGPGEGGAEGSGAESVVSPAAWVDPSASLAAGVRVGPGAVVGPGVVLGEGVVVRAGAVVGPGVRIGPWSEVGENASVTHCIIGARCVIQAQASIGERGFGYIIPDPLPDSGVVPVPHLGKVVLEDDVEVGAGSVIARAVLDETRIGRGVKLDAQCFVAHNVRIGRNSALMAQVAVAGSSQLGERVVVMGGASIAGHLTLGDGTNVGGMSGVVRSTEPGSFVDGNPALPFQETRRMFALLRRLASGARGGAASGEDGGGEDGGGGDGGEGEAGGAEAGAPRAESTRKTKP